MKKVFIIAEAGVNHNGSLRTALRMIDVAKKAGADAVKFQTFIPELVMSANAPKAPYQKRTTGAATSQIDMVRTLRLSFPAHHALRAHCRKRKITFLSTPFDLVSLAFLASLRLAVIKIPSGEITNLPLLKAAGRLRKRIILSTGMATIAEINAACAVLVGAGTPRRLITALQCTTAYPAPPEEANLRAMVTIRDRCRVAVGYSDHTLGTEAAVAAVALGATVIEKHFTLDKRMNGPDHAASAEPEELAALIRAVRTTEKMLGSYRKGPTRTEIENMTVARKSIVAARPIKKGERFDLTAITVKRPGNGISPMRWDRVIGKKAPRAFRKDELISL